MPKVGKLGGADQLVSCVFYNEKPIQQHFILHVATYMRHDTTNIGNQLGFHWQMTHEEPIIDVVHLPNIEQ